MGLQNLVANDNKKDNEMWRSEKPVPYGLFGGIQTAYFYLNPQRPFAMRGKVVRQKVLGKVVEIISKYKCKTKVYKRKTMSTNLV